jgi:hypothetical protein
VRAPSEPGTNGELGGSTDRSPDPVSSEGGLADPATARQRRLAFAALLALLVVAATGWLWFGPGPSGDDPLAEAPAPSETLWVADFAEGAWPDDFGVVAANHANARIVPQAPDGRPDVLRIVFGEDGQRWGTDHRHDLEALGVPEQDALVFAYDVYFPEDFEFIGDGKMGGLAGISDRQGASDASSGGSYDERSFSVRAMWKADRGLVMYLYARSAAGRDFDDPEHYGFGIAERFVKADGTSEGVLTPGAWHRIEHRVVLNTPGERDGVYELSVDGHVGVSLDDVEYRTHTAPDLRVNQVLTSWFFGGGSEQYPTRRNEAFTTDWVLSTPG